MALAIKSVCGKRTRKDGTLAIYLQYCFSSAKRVLLNTEILVPAKNWNKKLSKVWGDLPPEFGKAADLNAELIRQRRVLEELIAFGIQEKKIHLLEFVRENYTPRLDVLSLREPAFRMDGKTGLKLDFFEQYEDYMRLKERKVTRGMLGVFKNTRDILQKFQAHRNKKITFSEIDYNFYEELVDYLLFEHQQMRKKEVIKGVKTSTAGKVIKQFRIFLGDRIRRKIIPAIDMTDFKILNEESDAVYLSEQEIGCILRADLSDSPHLEKYRYMFVFGCLTGLRFSDFSSVKTEDVRDQRLYKKQEKSDHWVVVPLRPAAHNIFEKVFSRQFPSMSNPDFNYYIKEVGMKAGINKLITFSYKKGSSDITQTKPKYQWITSHTCRRSFCTNEFLAGMPAELIMKISGHKSLRDFYKYIRISPEQAAQQVEKIWKTRDSFAIVSE